MTDEPIAIPDLSRGAALDHYRRVAERQGDLWRRYSGQLYPNEQALIRHCHFAAVVQLQRLGETVS